MVSLAFLAPKPFREILFLKSHISRSIRWRQFEGLFITSPTLSGPRKSNSTAFSATVKDYRVLYTRYEVIDNHYSTNLHTGITRNRMTL